MLNQHILTTEPASMTNFAVADEELPDFVDMPFEDIEELPLDHPGATRRGISNAPRLYRFAVQKIPRNRRDNRR